MAAVRKMRPPLPDGTAGIPGAAVQVRKMFRMRPETRHAIRRARPSLRQRTRLLIAPSTQIKIASGPARYKSPQVLKNLATSLTWMESGTRIRASKALSCGLNNMTAPIPNATAAKMIHSRVHRRSHPPRKTKPASRPQRRQGSPPVLPVGVGEV